MRIKWLDIIRVFGLIVILLYHFFQSFLPGGFIGVDLFFVLAGYLATGMLLERYDREQRFRLKNFYVKRLWRLYPTLLLMVLVVVPFSLIANADYRSGLGEQTAAALSFTTNLYETASGGSYEARFIPHLFVHTWYLAVLMQDYLIWGALMALLAFVIKKKVPQDQRKVMFRFGVFALAGGLGLISYLIMMVRSIGLKEFSPVYFSTISHSFPFLLGSCLAGIVGISKVSANFKQFTEKIDLKQTLLAFGGSLLLILGLSFLLKFDYKSTYIIGLLLTSLLTLVAIAAARVLHDKRPLKGKKFLPILSFLSDTSYGVYLFHYPFFVILHSQLSTGISALLAFILSIILAALAFYVLEPLISGEPVRIYKKTWTLADLKTGLLLGTAFLAAASLLIIGKAPEMSALEKNLWTGNITQSVDSYSLTKDSILDSIQKRQGVKKGVTIIGDSVTLGTRESLLENVKDSAVDAQGNRNMGQAYEIMKEQQKNNQLREIVVFCIGTNATPDYEEQTLKVINDLEPGHRLIFMTPYDGNATPEYDSEKLAVFERSLPEKYDFVTIADWHTVASENKDIFAGTDGTHFMGNEKGDQLYAQCINEAIERAQAGPAKMKN